MSLLLAVVAVLAGLFGADDRDAACLILAGLDQERAAAYALVDPGRLRQVYSPASVAADDRAVIESYRRRGARVAGAVMHRISCAVAARTPDRIDLDVVDQLGPAVAISRQGRIRLLPRDGPTRHGITLIRTGAGWRIAAVTVSGT
ncbi:MAG TPA: hypothetical protein VK948_01595 [Aeromicrobium sp.]|nr:hypothetical protein [Aeromicrobium sp.]